MSIPALAHPVMATWIRDVVFVAEGVTRAAGAGWG